MRRFASRVGVVEVYDTEPTPSALAEMVRETGHLGRRFRPAFLWAFGRALPYVAVWASDGEVPDLTPRRPGTEDDLAGLWLAEIRTHACGACGARFRGVNPDGALAFRSRRGSPAHRRVDACPACESRSARLGFLVLLGPA
ncbi:hypothetical protein [Phytomonospora endophytica]|uniref:Uncharacterized protein n=1 Tax=Phytomonospora endophytica TaxID=714109 RepID=A0A841FPL3_9ACTN|nr:hypothetical protein [Phytomonospora endophytica]MBB6035738.1 hypothetical protein [Phytomonospora endophytica]GIG69584.1 hypothetical protein Pen01_58790 [Phytomonospora endophytica]